MSEPLFIDFSDQNASIPRASLIICAAPSHTSASAFESRLTKYLREKPTPGRVYVLGQIAESERLKECVEKDSFIDRLKGLSAKPEIVPVLLCPESSGMTALEEDWRTPRLGINLGNLRRESMLAVFREFGGMLHGDESHHYEKPSGKHSDRFIRTANVLRNAGATKLMALWVADRIDNNIKHIYCDTSTIHALVFQALLQRCTQNNHTPLKVGVDSFHSYDGIDQYEFQDPENSMALISASTSGDLVEKLIAKKGIPPSAISTLYYLGKGASRGHILCDLQKKDDSDGYALIDSRPAEDCPYCRNHSIPTLILGDQFLTERPKVSTYSLTGQDSPAWLRKLLNEVQNTDVFRVHRETASQGPVNLSIDLKCLLSEAAPQSFKDHLQQSLAKSVPVSAQNIIHTGSAGAIELAHFVLNHLKQHNPATSAKLFNSASLAELPKAIGNGTVVVVSDALSDGRDLMAINRILRNNHGKGAVNYLVAFATCATDKELAEIRTNLTYSGARGPATYMLEFLRKCPLPRTTVYLPWVREYKFLNDLEGFCESTSQVFPALFKKRKADLEEAGASGLHENVFLPCIHSGKKLALRRDFAFFDVDGDPNNVRQSVVYAAIAIVLNDLRNGSGKVPKLANEVHHRTILSPNNFDRFNDGIIQAAILRSAFPHEISYAKDSALSTAITDIILLVLRSWNNQDGEAGLEFVLAVANQTLCIHENDLAKVISELENSAEPLGIYQLVGKFIRQRLTEKN